MGEMGVKADWFTDLLTSDSDPFDTTSGSPVISLDSTEAELQERLRDLLEREARMDEMGITCPLKDVAESSCLACPVCHIGEPDSPLGALCRIGQEQERVITMIHAKAVGV